MASGAAVCLLGTFAPPAHAHHTGPGPYGWGGHGIGRRMYFMPGGPLESWTTGCIVVTYMEKYARGDRAQLWVTNGTVREGWKTQCSLGTEMSRIQIVTVNPATGQPDNTEAAHYVDMGFCGETEGDWRCVATGHLSIGPLGSPILGAHVIAASDNGVMEWWSVTV